MDRRRTTHRVAWLVAVAVVWLGLLSIPPARASCAGPLFELAQDGSSIAPRRVGAGDDEKILYDVQADLPLHLAGRNLTFDCQDTYGSTGCAGPQPASPTEPLVGAELVLVQGALQWPLATLDEIAPDLTADLVVELPADVRPGPATIARRDDDTLGDVLDLVIR